MKKRIKDQMSEINTRHTNIDIIVISLYDLLVTI